MPDPCTSPTTRGSLKLPTLLLLLALALLPLLYGQALPTATGPGSRIELGVGISGFQQDYGHRYIAGSTVSVALYPHWRVGLLGEARFLDHRTAEDVKLTTYMAGLRVALRPHSGGVQPYAKMMVGTGHIVLPFGYAQGNFLAYAPGGGLDIPLTDYIRLRAVDFEYQRWPDFPYGALHPYGITTGIAIRLNPLRRYPEGARHRGRIER